MLDTTQNGGVATSFYQKSEKPCLFLSVFEFAQFIIPYPTEGFLVLPKRSAA